MNATNKYKPRKYTSIWDKLRYSGECVILAIPSIHAKIIKAVTKEKYMDIEYKLLNKEKNVTSILEHKCVKNSIYFSLKLIPNLDNINEEEI